MMFLNLSAALGQEMNKKIVILGASHARHCEFTSDTSVRLLNNSVADFSSGQLYWNVKRVIEESPDVCIIQTGALDILLGIPNEKVIDILDEFYEKLDASGIKLVMIEDFPYWKEESLNEAFRVLNKKIRIFSEDHDILFISTEDTGIEGSEINPGDRPILTSSGCEKLQAIILKTLNYEIQE